MEILALKAIHFIGFVAWFAGLFYLPRLFVYHVEALGNPDQSQIANQLGKMEMRLYRIIMNPAMVLTLAAGIALLIIEPAYLKMGWMHVKLTLLVFLIGYHHVCLSYIKKLDKGTKPMSSERLRLFNEIPTLLLVSIILLAVFKDTLSMGTLLLILAALIVVLIIGTLVYKKVRERAPAK